MGDKSYELSNHLGNVLSVVSDRKTVTKDTKVFYDEHNQEHLWKPFGEVQEVFVNKENQWQITTKQPNTGAFLGLALEPNKTYSVSFNYLKKNSFCPNVLFKVVDGGDNEVVIKEQVLTQSEQIFTNFTPTIGDVKIYVLLQAETNEPAAEFALDNLLIYEINNSSANDFATLFIPDVKSFTDYDPFGMLIPERFGQSVDYRYGFNGKEKDNEAKGEGVQYDYGFRIYDARAGRFLSQDPLFKSYPWLTTYQFASNSPIWAVDLDGLESKIVTLWSGGTQTITKSSYEDEHGKGSWQSLKNGYYHAFANHEGWDKTQKLYKGNCSGYNGPLNGTLTIDATGSAAKISFTESGKIEAIKESFSAAKHAVKDLFISPTDYRGQKFKQTFWAYSLSVGTAPLTGGFALQVFSKASPFIFSKQSFLTGLIKTGISGGAQYLTGDGNVNLIGAGADGFLTVGASAFTGSAFEANINFNDMSSISTNSIFGNGDKSMTNFGIEATSSLLFGSTNGYFGRLINSQKEADQLTKDFVKNNVETIIQITNYQTQKEVKE